jgi:hypothetical protein
MANTFLNRLESIKYPLWISVVWWFISLPVAAIGLLAQNWSLFGLGIFVNTISTVSYLVDFVLNRIAKISYLNAAAVVEAIRQTQENKTDSQTNGSAAQAQSAPQTVKVTFKEKELPTFPTQEAEDKSEDSQPSVDLNDSPVVADSLIYWCSSCAAKTRIRENGLCLSGHSSIALLSYDDAQHDEANYCGSCRRTVYGTKWCVCPKCSNPTTWVKL